MTQPEEKYQQQYDALIAFGANQGDRQLAFDVAVKQIEENESVANVVASKAIETRPVTGTADGADNSPYLNACIRFTTTLDVEQLHQAMIVIESKLGRERKERWGPRTIDLDLLLFADQQLQKPSLIVPHPRMSFRRFVLEPALEIASDMVHPISGLTIEQLVHHLNSKPNTIVVATDDESFVQSVVENLSSRKEWVDWKVEVVADAMKFIQCVGETKLVASCFGDDPPQDLVRFAKNFAGPTIELSINSAADGCACELTAAIEAMSGTTDC
jgi:2-amino-4-hydroxy-6-hydroxymethyldihydropteridine diphosphokinase